MASKQWRRNRELINSNNEIKALYLALQLETEWMNIRIKYNRL